MPICSAANQIEVPFDIAMKFILSLYREFSNVFCPGQLIGFTAKLFFFNSNLYYCVFLMRLYAYSLDGTACYLILSSVSF